MKRRILLSWNASRDDLKVLELIMQFQLGFALFIFYLIFLVQFGLRWKSEVVMFCGHKHVPGDGGSISEWDSSNVFHSASTKLVALSKDLEIKSNMNTDFTLKITHEYKFYNSFSSICKHLTSSIRNHAFLFPPKY